MREPGTQWGGCLKKRLCWLFAGLLLALYLFWIEPNWIQVHSYTVHAAALPAAFDGFRVTEIADLHGKAFGENHTRLLRAVSGTAPDLIAIDGDLFDDKTDIASLDPLLTGLVEIAPVFYVTGNHEWTVEGLRGILEHLEALGVTVLENEFVTLSRGDAKIAVAGVHDPNGPYDMKSKETLVAEIRQALGEDVYILMLAHRNGQLAAWSALGVQTVLTGHGHGGLIRLPLVGGLIGVDGDLFPTYDAGVFMEGETTMVVSRGLGNSVFIPRIFNRPELPVITLESEE